MGLIIAMLAVTDLYVGLWTGQVAAGCAIFVSAAGALVVLTAD